MVSKHLLRDYDVIIYSGTYKIATCKLTSSQNGGAVGDHTMSHSVTSAGGQPIESRIQFSKIDEFSEVLKIFVKTQNRKQFVNVTCSASDSLK